MAASFDAIVDILQELDAPLPASEVHGLCCGLLCALPSTSAKSRWFAEVLEAAALSQADIARHADSLKAMDRWFGDTLTALNDSDLEFSPLVPDDASPVRYRIRSLGDFCSGFTYGIGIALTQTKKTALPDDSREIIEDFQAIDAVDLDDASQDGTALLTGTDPASSSDGAAGADHESIYNELLEFVRVGVLLVLEELRPVSPTSQGQPA